MVILNERKESFFLLRRPSGVRHLQCLVTSVNYRYAVGLRAVYLGPGAVNVRYALVKCLSLIDNDSPDSIGLTCSRLKIMTGFDLRKNHGGESQKLIVGVLLSP